MYFTERKGNTTSKQKNAAVAGALGIIFRNFAQLRIPVMQAGGCGINSMIDYTKMRTMPELKQEDINRLVDREILHHISAAADELRCECYMVGGCVRDLLLGNLSRDIHVLVVAGSGIQVAKAVASRLGDAELSAAKGTEAAKLSLPQGTVYFSGATALDDDLYNRDFTINAIAVCLNTDHFGEIVDPLDGRADLQDGIIATPGDPETAFHQDPLRMLRCIRFAATLKFQIEDETFAALERQREEINRVGSERVAGELNKIMMSPTPSRGLVELHRCGLLQLIMPELAALDVVETKNGRSHKNNFYHTLEVTDNVAAGSDNLWLRWAALLHDIGKPLCKRWDAAAGWTFHNHNYIGAKLIRPMFRRMKLPLDDRMKYVQKLVDLHMRPIVIADEEVTDSAVRRLLHDAGEDINDLMTLCEADITSRNEVKKKNFLRNFALVRQKLKEIEEKDHIRNFQPPVGGEEIMSLFHLPPCREVGILKAELKEAVLSGSVPNEHDAALAFVVNTARKLFPELDVSLDASES